MIFDLFNTYPLLDISIEHLPNQINAELAVRYVRHTESVVEDLI